MLKQRLPSLENGDLLLPGVVFRLKQLGYPLENAIVYYYSFQIGAFIGCGHDPLPKHCLLPKEEYEHDKTIKLRFKTGLKSEYCDSPAREGKAQKRTKERKIGYIIEKVALWRKLYNGMPDQSGKNVRYSLEEAAKQVGVSKKSLDDYLSQLRKGRRYGFDFNRHKDDKVGVLRAFVKKHEGPSR